MSKPPDQAPVLLTKTLICSDCFEQTDLYYWTHEPAPEKRCEHCGSTNVEEE